MPLSRTEDRQRSQRRRTLPTYVEAQAASRARRRSARTSHASPEAVDNMSEDDSDEAIMNDANASQPQVRCLMNEPCTRRRCLFQQAMVGNIP